MMAMLDVEKFLSKVSVPADITECWEWTGKANGVGYGSWTHRGKQQYAHRIACALEHGAIPPGYVVDHLCRNTMCVNPLHLEAVTHRENMMRGSKVTATECQRGHPFDGTNTLYIKVGGVTHRACRTCRNWRARELRRRRAR